MSKDTCDKIVAAAYGVAGKVVTLRGLFKGMDAETLEAAEAEALAAIVAREGCEVWSEGIAKGKPKMDTMSEEGRLAYKSVQNAAGYRRKLIEADETGDDDESDDTRSDLDKALDTVKKAVAKARKEGATVRQLMDLVDPK